MSAPSLPVGSAAPVFPLAPNIPSPPARQSGSNGNQLWLNKLERLAYKLCLRPERCAEHAAAGWAAVRPHPNQFEGVGQMCTPDKLREGVCSDRRLYVHAVCRAGQHLKREALERLGLWLVRVDPDDPGRVTVDAPPAGLLPCGGTTWAGNYSAPPRAHVHTPAAAAAAAAPAVACHRGALLRGAPPPAAGGFAAPAA
jgi:hypothetical protein